MFNLEFFLKRFKLNFISYNILHKSCIPNKLLLLIIHRDRVIAIVF